MSGARAEQTYLLSFFSATGRATASRVPRVSRSYQVFKLYLPRHHRLPWISESSLTCLIVFFGLISTISHTTLSILLCRRMLHSISLLHCMSYLLSHTLQFLALLQAYAAISSIVLISHFFTPPVIMMECKRAYLSLEVRWYRRQGFTDFKKCSNFVMMRSVLSSNKTPECSLLN